MLRKYKSSLTRLIIRSRKGGGLVLAVIAATVVGSITTAAVLAAVPDSNGTIHGCYRNSAGLFNPKGSLRVIDPGNGETCTSQEASLSWSQNGASTGVYDANGQLLGNLLSTSPGSNSVQVYNSTINRDISISIQNTNSIVVAVGSPVSAYFASSDCTGQAYTPATVGGSNIAIMNAKTDLYSWQSGASITYGVVSDSAAPSTVTTASYLGAGEQAGQCFQTNPGSQSAYALTTVSLPFTTPATPLKF